MFPNAFERTPGGRSRLFEKSIWFVLLVLFRFLDSGCTGGCHFFFSGGFSMNLIMDKGVVRSKGEMTARIQVLSPAERSEAEWSTIRMAIFRALEPFDGAREAVVEALVALCAMTGEEATGDS